MVVGSTGAAQNLKHARSPEHPGLEVAGRATQGPHLLKQHLDGHIAVTRGALSRTVPRRQNIVRGATNRPPTVVDAYASARSQDHRNLHRLRGDVHLSGV